MTSEKLRVLIRQDKESQRHFIQTCPLQAKTFHAPTAFRSSVAWAIKQIERSSSCGWTQREEEEEEKEEEEEEEEEFWSPNPRGPTLNLSKQKN